MKRLVERAVRVGEPLAVPDDVDVLNTTVTGMGTPRYIKFVALVPDEQTYDCGAETDSGEYCSIDVDTPFDRCHLHD